jgi:hypothetical protein
MMTTESEKVFVGVDLSKAYLDVAVHPYNKKRWSVANDESGIYSLVASIKAMYSTSIVLEDPGGLEGPPSGLRGGSQSTPGARLCKGYRNRWPRPISSTPELSLGSVRRYDRRYGPRKTRKPKNSPP